MLRLRRLQSECLQCKTHGVCIFHRWLKQRRVKDAVTALAPPPTPKKKRKREHGKEKRSSIPEIVIFIATIHFHTPNVLHMLESNMLYIQ